MNNVIFTENSIALNGQILPATYAISENNAVHAYVTLTENGESVTLRIEFKPDHEHHAAAMAAAIQAVRPATICAPEDEEHAENTQADLSDEVQEASEPKQDEQPAPDPKKARGEVPEKLFAGLEITGNGWKILFDKTHERTRVIFKDMPSKAAREACKNAGFYWSPVLKSWNKKLTFKAFRKAQLLAVELRAICG